ncbi:hypothetical protein [Agrobacterium genomosp. 2]|uniref:hypothetical protein n=1 Tax=Agrobacterium genomosp. 2 TaxID=1183409 RepID=UPI00111BA5C1|nr:hypothetical protein [Agrobacterium genomosp. 2]
MLVQPTPFSSASCLEGLGFNAILPSSLIEDELETPDTFSLAAEHITLNSEKGNDRQYRAILLECTR